MKIRTTGPKAPNKIPVGFASQPPKPKVLLPIERRVRP